jgi:hypothetical protein
MADLFGIMNILDPGAYDDQEAFFGRYGREMPTAEQVLALQVGGLLLTLLLMCKLAASCGCTAEWELVERQMRTAMHCLPCLKHTTAAPDGLVLCLHLQILRLPDTKLPHLCATHWATGIACKERISSSAARASLSPAPLLPVQDALRPVLLRRMKEDVETLPDKEEIVVWVELTPEQRHYYRAIFAKEVLLPVLL